MNKKDADKFCYQDLTTSDWWVHHISSVPNWVPGGVFLICTGPMESVAAARAWFCTAINLYTEKLEKGFSEIVLIVPPGTKQLNYQERFKNSLKSSLDQTKKEIPSDIRHYLDASDWPWVQSDAETVLKRLETVPKMSAVAIAGAERLRFPKLERVIGTLTSTHSGIQVSHYNADDLLLPHLQDLLRQLLKLANARELSIVVFVENFEFELGKFSDDLRSHPNLAVFSTRYSDKERSRYSTLIKALEILRTSGLEAAIQFVQENIPNGDSQAHAISYIYSNCGLWTQAWNVLSEHVATLRKSKEPTVLLNMAQAAAGCGEAKSASELLKEAFELGFETVESFNAAAILTESIDATELFDQIIAEMRIAYPRHPMTVARAFDRLMITARYNEAAEMAAAVGLKFDAAWAHLRSQTTPDWTTFIKIGRDTNNELNALAKCVYHALQLGQSQKAREFFNLIPDSTTTATLRAELLFDILKKETYFAKSDDDLKRLVNEWTIIFVYLSANTSDSGLRGRVLQWFEASADDLSRITILMQAMMDAYQKAAPLFEPANATNENSPWDFAKIEESSEKTIDFMRVVAETSRSCPLGRAVAPPEYATSVPNEVMEGLGVLVRAFSKEPDLKGIMNVLQCLNLACRIRREPSWDFEAAIQLTSALASGGAVSDALNLTENILVFWSEGEFGAARRAHAWSCKADVYHRARNPLTSLLYLILCFESMVVQPAHQHCIFLKHKLRLAIRILRDLNFPELASIFLNAWAKLIQAFPKNREEREWHVTQIGCRLRQIDETTKLENLEELASSIQRLLEDEKEDEWGPPVSIALSFVNLSHHYGFKVNDRFIELIQKRLSHCPLSAQNLFRYFFLERPSVGELQAAVHDIVEGNAHDDEGFGLATLEGLLQRSITTACQNNDPELFAIAANWLSQPALAASRASREAANNQPEIQLTPVDEIIEQGNSINQQQMRDYATAMQHQIERMKSNFVQIPELPISAAKYVATPNEIICLLAHNANGNLCKLVVRRNGIEKAIMLSKSDWDVQKYQTWKIKYPHEYSWDQRGEALGPVDVPNENTIRDSLNSLQPGLPTDTRLLTILPESDLFGFSFFLTSTSSGWLGQATTCITAPSLSWLAAVRQLPTPNLRLKGWLGDPINADLAVECARSELKPFIRSVSGALIEAATPQSIGSCGLSVILSHGSQGMFGGFAGVNDFGHFTNEELARWLGESACVVLFVCNAGRNDGRRFNQETFGIIGQLLRRGVRAVIAPPAPIRFDLPAIWFPPFYQELQQGKTVGQAYAAACGQVRRRFDHPCAWGALQLFGDAQLSFST